jgi:hypothetical protein
MVWTASGLGAPNGVEGLMWPFSLGLVRPNVSRLDKPASHSDALNAYTIAAWTGTSVTTLGPPPLTHILTVC